MLNLKKLKSLFIVEEEEENTEVSPEINTETPVETDSSKEVVGNIQHINPTQTVNYTQTSNVINTNLTVAGMMDAKVLETLMAALEANNLDGFDYLEFKNSIKSLNAMPTMQHLDEATKFRTAFATASTMGVTLERLQLSSEYYKNILKKELQKFEEVFKKNTSEQLSKPEKQAELLAGDILNKQEQIKILTEQIAAQTQQINQIKVDLVQAQSSLELQKNNFQITYDSLLKQMEDDLNKMNTYLK